MSETSRKVRHSSPEGSATWECIATLSCSLLIFCVGCIPGWTSPTLDILMRPGARSALTPSDASTLAAMMNLGQILAPALSLILADRLGRKNSLLATGVPLIISWGLISVSRHIMVLFAARFIGGLSLGMIHCFPQMYLGEIASARLRGAIGMVCGMMLNAGILFMFVMVPYLSVQRIAHINFSIAILAAISLRFIPESPYFLAMVGKTEKAEGALEKLRGKTDVGEELDLIKLTVSEEGKSRKQDGEEDQETRERLSAWKQLFSISGNRKALAINFLFTLVLQFGSHISFMIYGQIIFKRMKTGLSPHLCMMILASLQIVCNILTAFVIDRLGRRPLIFVSGLLSGVCLLAVGVYFYLMEYAQLDVSRYGILALCAVLANIIVLNIGLVPLQHVIQSEILATEVKGLATSIIGVGGGVIAAIGVKSYLTLAETWDFGHCVPFFGFVFNTWLCTGLILKFLPETKGKSLFQIQKDLNAH